MYDAEPIKEAEERFESISNRLGDEASVYTKLTSKT